MSLLFENKKYCVTKMQNIQNIESETDECEGHLARFIIPQIKRN